MFGGPGMPGPNPEDNPLWEAIRGLELNEQGTIMFLMQAPDFIEDDDMNIVKKNYPVLIRNFVFGTVLGITANLQLKRIPNFLHWNRLIRFSLRIPTFFAPFGLFYFDTLKRVEEMSKPLRKYQDRLLKFQKTGNQKYLDPEGKLERKMKEKMGF